MIKSPNFHFDAFYFLTKNGTIMAPITLLSSLVLIRKNRHKVGHLVLTIIVPHFAPRRATPHLAHKECQKMEPYGLYCASDGALKSDLREFFYER